MFYLYYFVFVYECFVFVGFFRCASLCICVLVSSSSSSCISKQQQQQQRWSIALKEQAKRELQQVQSFLMILYEHLFVRTVHRVCISRLSESLFLFDRFCRIYTLRNHHINFYSETHLGSGYSYSLYLQCAAFSALQVSSLKSVFPCEQIFLITRRFCQHLSVHIGAHHIHTFSEKRSICCKFSHSVVR